MSATTRPRSPARDLRGRVASTGPVAGTSASSVLRRRLVAVLLVVGPVIWAWQRATADSQVLVNVGGVPLLGTLLRSVLAPRLDPEFLLVVVRAAGTTVAFAALGTAGALLIGGLGGLALSDITWPRRPPLPLRLFRAVLRLLLVSMRAIHEIIWALLLVSVLGLDPLVAILAIALPFGAQTAKVYAETLDTTPAAALDGLRQSGARPAAAMLYGLLPAARPVLISYGFYRFECAVRSAVILGVVGVGGLGQELVLTLASRNWDEVWTLLMAVLALSAAIDAWSSLIRSKLSVANCADWSSGTTGSLGIRPSNTARWSLILCLPLLAVCWFSTGVSWSGLTSERTRRLAGSLVDDLWPPALPRGGMADLIGATLDTVAMAVLAMTLAVAITAVLAPAAMHPRQPRSGPGRALRHLIRTAHWAGARVCLLVLRSVPPSVWAILALLVLFPGVIPGAVALGLYTAGILGRLVAEAWETLDPGPADVLVQVGTSRPLAQLVALGPPSVHYLITYTLYRFEICIRDTAIVGVVGAAGLGRLLNEQLASFRFPAVAALLIVSIVLSLGAEVLGRQLRATLRP